MAYIPRTRKLPDTCSYPVGFSCGRKHTYKDATGVVTVTLTCITDEFTWKTDERVTEGDRDALEQVPDVETILKVSKGVNPNPLT